MKPEQFIRDKPRLVYGIGINDWIGSTYDAKIGRRIPEYRLWHRMLERAYCAKYKERNPTYKNTTVDKKWFSLTGFIDEVSSLRNYDKAINEGWHLDKDIIRKGNKHYSLELCCFVPKEINVLLTNSRATRGLYPIGVCFSKRDKYYQASVKVGNKNKHLGCFDNPIDAFYAYKTAKEAYIKALANEYVDYIDSRVYDALMNYSVEILD